MSQHGCPERLSNRSKGFQEDGSSQPTMEVLVETLTGTAFEMTVSPSDTIFAIKSKIYRVEGIPVSQQHLLYNLQELEDSASLLELSISDGARLRLVLGLRGGPISTRRLPPPPPADAPWRDIERLLDSNREESAASGAVGGCKVTVLVFREGERVNMLRVRENDDGTYSPIDHAKYSSPLSRLCETMTPSPPASPLPPTTGGQAGGSGSQVGGSGAAGDDGLSTSVAENALTMGKMLELRRRMDSLSVQRRPNRLPEPEVIQKTRSEESLSAPRLELAFTHTYAPYSHAHTHTHARDDYTPLYDYNYNKYDYDCSFADRYTLLPPIGRTESEETISSEERVKLSEALSGSILVKSRRELALPPGESPPAARHRHNTRAAIAAHQYGPLAVSDAGAPPWRSHYGSSSALPPGAGGGGEGAAGGGTRGGTRGGAGGPGGAVLSPPPPLSDALFSSSTSDLEKLKRNRILPALSRHRNREHLHLSDEGLSASNTVTDLHTHAHAHTHTHLQSQAAPGAGARLEVGSERRLRRINRDVDAQSRHQPPPPPAPLSPPPPPAPPASPPAPAPPPPTSQKKLRLRCGYCNKRLSIATEHACRCGRRYCAQHRYAEVHGCRYDYKADLASPVVCTVQAPKLPKI